MTIQEYKKAKSIINKALKDLEDEAVESGNIMSDEYEEAVLNLKKLICDKLGYDFGEYQEMDNSKLDKVKVNYTLKEYDKKLKENAEKWERMPRIFSEDDIHQIARMVVESYKQPPQIINKIVREIIREKPIIETKIDNTEIENVRKDVVYIQERFADYTSEVSDIFSDLKKMIPSEGIIMEKIENFKRWNETEDKLNLIRQTISRMTWGFQDQIDKLGGGTVKPADFEWIDLSAQCNSVLQTFDLGQTVKSILIVQLNEGIPTYTSTLSTITLTTVVPDFGEVLRVLCIV